MGCIHNLWFVCPFLCPFLFCPFLCPFLFCPFLFCPFLFCPFLCPFLFCPFLCPFLFARFSLFVSLCPLLSYGPRAHCRCCLMLSGIEARQDMTRQDTTRQDKDKTRQDKTSCHCKRCLSLADVVLSFPTVLIVHLTYSMIGMV